MGLQLPEKRQLLKKIDEFLSNSDYECLEIDWLGKERILQIFIDRVDSQAVSLEDCAAVSEKLSSLKEIEDYVEEAFELEISSPGVNRPLRKLEHFRQVIGQTIKVKLAEAQKERRAAKGKVQSVGEDGLVCLSTTRGEWAFGIDGIEQACLVYDWKH